MVELTVPWEEGCEKVSERKTSKYQQLVNNCRENGWLFPVEVGCRGFPAQTVWNLLTRVRLRGQIRRKAVQRLGEDAEKPPCWLWHKKKEAVSWSSLSTHQLESVVV